MPSPDYAAAPPRRALVRFDEPQLKALLGLAVDESLRAVVFDPVVMSVIMVVESPRLPALGHAVGGVPVQPAWGIAPPFVSLPLSQYYVQPTVAPAVGVATPLYEGLAGASGSSGSQLGGEVGVDVDEGEVGGDTCDPDDEDPEVTHPIWEQTADWFGNRSSN